MLCSSLSQLPSITPAICGNFLHSICAKSESPSCEDHVQDRQEKTASEKMKAVLDNGFDDDMTGIDDRPVF